MFVKKEIGSTLVTKDDSIDDVVEKALVMEN